MVNTKIVAEIECRSQLEKEFNFILRRVMNESFKSISRNFGSVVYYVLEQKYGVKEKEISDYTVEFSKCLQEVFGKEGRRYIEALITKKLYIKIKIERDMPKMKEKDFTERVELAKQRYIEKKRI